MGRRSTKWEHPAALREVMADYLLRVLGMTHGTRDIRAVMRYPAPLGEHIPLRVHGKDARRRADYAFAVLSEERKQ